MLFRPVVMITMLFAWLSVAGCARCCKAQVAASGPTVARNASLEPFTQSIEGTTVSFEMLPGGQAPVWISKTEVPWELYDLFTYGLDDTGTEGNPGVDAVSRPSRCCKAQVAASGPTVARNASLEPFTQSIEGTTVSFEMLPGGQAPVWISKTEVPWELYDLFTYGLDDTGTEGNPGVDAVSRPSKPYISMDRGFGRAGYPVISVSYHGAQTFCEWLSRKTGRRFRLPTEAEWMSACGAASPIEPQVGNIAWYVESACAP